MSDAPPTKPEYRCPKCHGAMEFGLLADGTHSNGPAWSGPERAAQWVRGSPEKAFLIGNFKADGTDRLSVATLRCVGCGYLEMYAR